MFPISKAEIVRMLSENLSVFFPHLHDQFMCPTCLRTIPIQTKEEISEAHIIPQAAGGTLKTFLCRTCNSMFGSRQDKWFGERVRLVKDAANYLDTRIKTGHFEIENIRVNGYWEKNERNDFDFVALDNRNSPEVNRKLIEKFSKHPSEIKVSFKVPLLQNERLVRVGFLTAGYLMWFAVAGYSWVLQRHLDPIRQQILNPEKELLPRGFSIYFRDKPWEEPQIGTMSLFGELAIVMVYQDHVAVFPPADRPGLYSNLGQDFSGKQGKDFYPLKFLSPRYGAAVSFSYENRLLISSERIPDLIDAGGPIAHVHLRKDQQPQILFPMAPDKFQSFARKGNPVTRISSKK